MNTAAPAEAAARVTLTALKERGWTDTLVRDFLSEPDATARNPRYKSAPRVKLYAMPRILAAEASDAFKAAKAKASVRSNASKAAAEVRRSDLIAEVRKMMVTVTDMPMALLMQQSLEDWQANARDGEWRDGSTADQATRNRWAVNYARHNLSHYDSALAALAGRVGINDGVALIRGKIYAAIALAFPELADECLRQADDRGAATAEVQP